MEYKYLTRNNRILIIHYDLKFLISDTTEISNDEWNIYSLTLVSSPPESFFFREAREILEKFA